MWYWLGQGLLGGTMQGLCVDAGQISHIAFTRAGVVGVAAAEAEYHTTTRE